MKDVFGKELRKGSKVLVAYGVNNFRPAKIEGFTPSGKPLMRFLDTEDSDMNGQWGSTQGMVRVSRWPAAIRHRIIGA